VFLADRIGTQWRPALEWRIETPGGIEEPFDVEARATFRHEESGETRTTPFFYDGDAGFGFRFTATRTGKWTFTTSSKIDALDGRRGAATILSHPDPGTHGFLKSFGSKWGWQGTERAFVPQLVMYSGEVASLGDPDFIERAIEVFLDGHGFNGFHVPSIGAQWFDHRRTNERVEETMTHPDPVTFAALERVITRTHAAGGSVHIW